MNTDRGTDWGTPAANEASRETKGASQRGRPGNEKAARRDGLRRRENERTGLRAEGRALRLVMLLESALADRKRVALQRHPVAVVGVIVFGRLPIALGEARCWMMLRREHRPRLAVRKASGSRRARIDFPPRGLGTQQIAATQPTPTRGRCFVILGDATAADPWGQQHGLYTRGTAGP